MKLKIEPNLSLGATISSKSMIQDKNMVYD
jgi:hypothetical protein